MHSVLIVDDEPILLQVTRAYLEKSGDISVDAVDSGEKALSAIRKKQYDAVVSDYLMPGMDGISLLRELRSSGNDIPFIIFTGRGREEVVIEAFDSGADSYIQKGGDPVSQFRELVHKINQSIAGREIRKALEESETKFRNMVELSPNLIIHSDSSGRALYASPSSREILGYEPGEIIGKRYTDFIEPGNLDLVEERAGFLLSGEGRDFIEVKFLRKDGTYVDLELSAVSRLNGKKDTILVIGREIPDRRGDGNVSGICGVEKDSPGDKGLENALALANRKLALLSRITRHDLRNKITAILGYMELQRDETADETILGLIDLQESSLDEMNEIIEFLKKYETVESGPAGWIALRPAISEYLSANDTGRIPVRIELEGLEIFTDPIFPIIFSDLVKNSVEHGGDVSCIRIWWRRGDGYTGIFFEDDGCGIPVENKGKIFNKGFGSGNGLGLYYVSEIVGVLGMSITETGEEGKGALFEIRVPPVLCRYPHVE